jgi:hypothetical protein
MQQWICESYGPACISRGTSNTDNNFNQAHTYSHYSSQGILWVKLNKLHGFSFWLDLQQSTVKAGAIRRMLPAPAVKTNNFSSGKDIKTKSFDTRDVLKHWLHF